METLIIAAGIIGFFLLLAVTITLVKLNWSEKTLAPVLSILLVGTATTLVTITVPLKKSTIESAFAASVVLDTSQGVVPFEIPRAADDKATAQLSELAKLARPVVNSGGKGTITIKYPTTDNERFTFCTELLQYRLLHIIADLQHEGWKAGYSFGASAASVHTPMKLPDNQDYSTQALLAAVAGNRFSNSDFERFDWEHTGLQLPKKTKLSLFSLPPPGGGKYVVMLDKPMFFRIEFEIEPLLATGAGALPKGLVLTPEVAARCQTFHFRVTMRATFEKITAGNYRTQDYKDWANELFSGVQATLGD